MRAWVTSGFVMLMVSMKPLSAQQATATVGDAASLDSAVAACGPRGIRGGALARGEFKTKASGDRLVVAIDSTLSMLGYLVADTSQGPTRWITAPRFGWPRKVPSAAFPGVASPGWRLSVSVKSDRKGPVKFEVHTICGTGAPPNEQDGPAYAMILTVAASEFATELKRRLDQ